jgi:hypothetical protein
MARGQAGGCRVLHGADLRWPDTSKTHARHSVADALGAAMSLLAQRVG